MFKELNIMRLFFKEPSREFGVREAAKLLDVAPATASKDLSELSMKGYLKMREDRRMILYSANSDSDYFRDLKVFNTIKTIKEKGFLEAIKKEFVSPAIVLYGSASNGSDKEISSLDFLIISDKTSEFLEREHFEKLFGKSIHISVVKKLSDLKNNDLIKQVLNGKVLQGEIEVENGG